MPLASHEDAARIRSLRIPRRRYRQRPGPMLVPAEPESQAVDYFASLLRFMAPAKRLVDRLIVAHLRELLGRSDAAREDSGRDVNQLMDDIERRFWANVGTEDLERLGERIGRATARFQREQLGRVIQSAIGIPLDSILGQEPWLRKKLADFVAANVALIKTIPSQYFGDVEKRVTNAIRKGTRFEDLAKELEDRYDVSESRAELIARDQVGKFYGAMAEARQTQLGITEYVWRTMHDNLVRPDHKELDGQTFSWDDPPEDGHPGEPINCRCYAEPVLANLLDELNGVEPRVRKVLEAPAVEEEPDQE